MKVEVSSKEVIWHNLESETLFNEPSLYQVILYNDDFTPMEFVVEMLERLFYMDRQRATALTMKAHLQGSAAWGRFSKDLAETKVVAVMEYARLHEHPLICGMDALRC